MSCNLKKKTWGAMLHCLAYISKIVWWLPMWWGPVRVFEKFRSPFSFLFFHFFVFFSFLHFRFCLSLGALLAPGPLDIVHPCHPVATPLRFLPFLPDFSSFFPLFSRCLAIFSLSGVALYPPCTPSGYATARHHQSSGLPVRNYVTKGVVQ